MWQKFKTIFGEALGDDTLYFSLLLVAVAVTAFGLGRMSANETSFVSRAVFQEIASTSEQGSLSVATVEFASTTATQYVASKSGTKYHLPWCPGAQQMKEENKIYFASQEEAEAAGYSKASNCKGL